MRAWHGRISYKSNYGVHRSDVLFILPIFWKILFFLRQENDFSYFFVGRKPKDILEYWAGCIANSLDIMRLVTIYQYGVTSKIFYGFFLARRTKILDFLAIPRIKILDFLQDENKCHSFGKMNTKPHRDSITGSQ